MMGYSGALVGAAAALFTGFSWLAVSLTIIGAFACVAIHEGLRRLFGTSYLQRYGLPVSTAPFCLVASVIFGALGRLVETSPLSSSSGVSGLGLGLGLTNSFSEVVLADGWLSGLIILIALFYRLLANRPLGFGGRGNRSSHYLRHARRNRSIHWSIELLRRISGHRLRRGAVAGPVLMATRSSRCGGSAADLAHSSGPSHDPNTGIHLAIYRCHVDSRHGFRRAVH